MRFITTVLTVITVLLTIPCSIASGVADWELMSNTSDKTTTGLSPQPVPQLAQPGEPGYIRWNQDQIPPGATVYILSLIAPRDINGYVFPHAFRKATKGVYLYSRTEQEEQVGFVGGTWAEFTFHYFQTPAGIFKTIKIIPQQNVVLYGFPTPPQESSKPGDIDYNKTELQPGATVYILPTNTPLDQNGYVPLYAFKNAIIGTYLYVQVRDDWKSAVDVTKSFPITYHGFKRSSWMLRNAKMMDDDVNAGAFETQRTIPQQRVVFYNLSQHSAIPSYEEYVCEADGMGFSRSFPPIMF